MASNFTDEERNERIILVGEYFLDHPDSSTRKIAEHFSSMDNGFRISNATVCQYIKKFKEMVSIDKSMIIDNSINSNKPEGIDSKDVRDRILYFVSLMLDQNMTLQDIVDYTGVPFWVVYRDLTRRLPKIDKDLYLQVSDLMYTRRLENLCKHK